MNITTRLYFPEDLELFKMLVNQSKLIPSDSTIQDAIIIGNLDLVKLLIGYGCKISFKNYQLAVIYGNYEIVKHLGGLGYHDIDNAALYGHLNIVRYYLENGVAPSSNTLNNGICGGNLDIVKYLVENGCEPCGIREAAKHGHYDILCYLVKCGCNPGIFGNSPFVLAFKNGHMKIVEYLFELGYCDENALSKSQKFQIVSRVKSKLKLFLNGRNTNPYFMMEILFLHYSSFSEYEIIKM